MKRREFTLGVGGAAALPLSAQQPEMPVIGFLDSRSADAVVDRLAGFRQGSKTAGMWKATT